MPALFVQGNSALNIKSGAGISGEKYKQIVKAVFGDGPKDKAILAMASIANTAKRKTGSTCRRASLRFTTCLKRAPTCATFCATCASARKWAAIIGTTYDGATMFDALKADDSIAVMHKGTRVAGDESATATEFPDDETCVGYAIDVTRNPSTRSSPRVLGEFQLLETAHGELRV